MTQDYNPILPRLRIYGEIAEFETEQHLECFFVDRVLEQIGLKLLRSQYVCRQGICDILAKGTDNQLVIIELKNNQDSHVIEQITKYYDALIEEQPFAEQIDYTKPINLYIVCPSYSKINDIVRFVGYVENGRKSWLICTSHELDSNKFATPAKLRKQKWSREARYWKGLAMPTEFYLQTMKLSEYSHSLDSFVELALKHSLQRLNKNR